MSPSLTASLLARVRISIPVSGDAATVLAAIGGVMMIGMVLFFARAKVKEDGKAGWYWLGGWITFLLGAFAALIFLGQMGDPENPYTLTAVSVAVLGGGSALLMRAAAHPKHALSFAALFGLASLGKLLFRAPINIIRDGDEISFAPAGYGDPKMLTIVALVVFFGVLLAWIKRSAPRPA